MRQKESEHEMPGCVWITLLSTDPVRYDHKCECLNPLFLECSVGCVLKLLHCVKTKTKSEFRFCFQMVVTGLPERSKNSDSTGSSPEVQKDATLEARTLQIKSLALVFLLLRLFL